MYKLFCALALASPLVFAQTPVSDSSQKVYESVWAWKLSTPTREVYLLGELHQFNITKDEQISHSLAKRIFDMPNQVFCENTAIADGYAGKRLQDRISASSWEKFKEAVQKAVAITPVFVKDVPPQQISDNLINFLDKSNYYALKSIFPGMAITYQHRIQNHLNFKTVPGFLQENVWSKNTKCLFLEPKGHADTVWNQHCGVNDDALSEKLIRAYLPYFDQHNEVNQLDGSSLAQTEFLRLDADKDSLSLILRRDRFASEANLCNLKPRNTAWFEVIKPQLAINGPPIVIIAGAGHIVGEYGLLSMLCQAGYCSAKRIFKLE